MAAFYGVMVFDPKHKVFGLTFPDLPGCVTSAKSIEELSVLAAEALNLHLAGMVEDSEPIPARTTFDDMIKISNEYCNFEGLMLVTAKADSKKIRVNVCLSEIDLQLIDLAASRMGINRSEFIAIAGRKFAL